MTCRWHIQKLIDFLTKLLQQKFIRNIFLASLQLLHSSVVALAACFPIIVGKILHSLQNSLSSSHFDSEVGKGHLKNNSRRIQCLMAMLIAVSHFGAWFGDFDCQDFNCSGAI